MVDLSPRADYFLCLVFKRGYRGLCDAVFQFGRSLRLKQCPL